ncbi:8461_t:CDS:2 [Funneliformis mosseae]|uniref:8461_t:CDS:1 n=1 Tax=Funneliformis mosseae TaxID=27381 RepID=A0A9N8V1J4_FUNMO|nr:8461_t:CDS:2 [Funneliformis mosseae]
MVFFCFVVGDDLERSFEVTGDDKMTKSKLREIIYEKIIKVLMPETWIYGRNRGEKLSPFSDLATSLSMTPRKSALSYNRHCSPPLVNQGLTDISRKITDLGYLPRQDGLGGTSLNKSEQNAFTVEGISLTHPDTNQRSDLVSCLAKRLEEKRVILVQAPPYSGKTLLSQLLENYLVVNSSKLLRGLRVSLALLLLWGLSVGKNCEYDTFCEVWEKIVGVEWCEWVGQCRKVPSILIIDEVQKIYKDMNEADESMMNTGTAIAFWDTIKMCLQWSNLSVIRFAAYGYSTNLYYQ